jgi:predicted nucleotidyltransferase
MPIQPVPLEEFAREVVAELARIPQVLAVAMAGSITSGNHDARSDIDLYVYAHEEVPVELRREITERRGVRAQVDNRFWETGDEWDERDSGTHVDVMFRSPAFAEDSLAHVLDRHEASLGYTTALWHNLRTSQVLFDRDGWLARVKASASRAYPDELARAIIAKNWPLVRGAASAYPRRSRSRRTARTSSP